MYRTNLKSVSLPVPEITATEVLGGVAKLRTPILWSRRPYRVGDDMVRKSVGELL